MSLIATGLVQRMIHRQRSALNSALKGQIWPGELFQELM